jgi:hypothetical protein
MAYTENCHKQLNLLTKQITAITDQWRDFIPARIFHVIADVGKHSFKIPIEVQDEMNSIQRDMHIETGSVDAWNSATTYVDNLRDAIRSIRKRRKERQAYSPLAEHKSFSKNFARHTVSEAFQRSWIGVSLKTTGNEPTLEVDGERKYTIKNFVTIGVTWYRTVASRGFALINAPQGLRFVVSCKYRYVQYVDEDGMNAWEVQTIGFKNGKGFEESGWLVTHQSTEHDECHPLVCESSRQTEIPHAVGKNLSKAHSLLKQRTVRHLTKMLDA